jgi:hypothetical protein
MTKIKVCVLLASSWVAIGLFLTYFSTDGCAQVPCEKPPHQSNTATIWELGKQVNVVIDPSFDSDEKNRISAQLGKWEKAGSLGVKFHIKAAGGSGQPGGGQRPILIVDNSTPTPSTAQGALSTGQVHNGP